MSAKKPHFSAKVNAVTDALVSVYGEGSVSIQSGADGLRHWRFIETGIFPVDRLCGGGIPHGFVTGAYGVESAGKTFLALRTVAGGQRTCRECVVPMVITGKKLNLCPTCGTRDDKADVCPNCTDKPSVMIPNGDDERACPSCGKYLPMRTLYMDAEHSIMSPWSATNGVDTSIVLIHQPKTAEEAINGSIEYLKTGEIDICVADTLAMFTPKEELAQGMDKWQQGMQARVINKGIRAWVSRMNDAGVHATKRTTFLLLNQIRFKIGVFFGNPVTKPGGKGQDFAPVIMLKMWSGKTEQDKIGNTVASILCASTDKNKVTGKDKQEANFRLWKSRVLDEHDLARRLGDTEEDRVLFDYGMRFELIEKVKGGYALPGVADPVPTQEAVRKLLYESADARKALRTKLFNPALEIGAVWYSTAALDKARKRDSKEDE